MVLISRDVFIPGDILWYAAIRLRLLLEVAKKGCGDLFLFINKKIYSIMTLKPVKTSCLESEFLN